MEQKECLVSLEIFFARLSKCILFVALPTPTLMSAVHLSKEDTTRGRIRRSTHLRRRRLAYTCPDVPSRLAYTCIDLPTLAYTLIGAKHLLTFPVAADLPRLALTCLADLPTLA